MVRFAGAASLECGNWGTEGVYPSRERISFCPALCRRVLLRNKEDRVVRDPWAEREGGLYKPLPGPCLEKPLKANMTDGVACQ